MGMKMDGKEKMVYFFGVLVFLLIAYGTYLYFETVIIRMEMEGRSQ
jgi:hypothetical protein